MADSPKKLDEMDTQDPDRSSKEIDNEIEKVSNRMEKINNELKKNLTHFKNSRGDAKSKWKKEAAFCLKKKKFYEEYIIRLNKTKHEKEMKHLQQNIDTAKLEFQQLSKEFYENLSYLYQQCEDDLDEEDEDFIDYELEIDDSTLDSEYNKILPELNNYIKNIDLGAYLKINEEQFNNAK